MIEIKLPSCSGIKVSFPATIFILTFAILFGLTQMAKSQSIRYNVINAGNGTYQFSVDTVGLFTTEVVLDYFWVFGDSSWTDVKSPIHVFSNDAPTVVYVELTPMGNLAGIYHEDDQVTRLFVDDGVYDIEFTPTCSDGTCGGSGPQSLSLASPISAQTNRKLVPGEMVTYAIHYTHSCPGIDASISFNYNSSIMEPEASPDFLEDHFPRTPDNYSPGFYKWDNLSLNTSGMIYVRMRVKEEPDASVGDMVSPSIKLNYTPTNKECPGSKTNIVLGEQIALSHDPNELTSNDDFACDQDQFTEIKYNITFQNFGETSAETVIIKDILPDDFVLSTSSITTIHPEFGGQTPAPIIDHSTREVRWELSGNFLKGTDELKGKTQPGYGSSFFEDATLDSLVFSVPLANPSNYTKCETIVNRAEIIFDCNPSIFTNIFKSSKGCSGCEPCREYGIVEMDTTFLSTPDFDGMSTANLSFDNAKSTLSRAGYPAVLGFDWFPKNGITNPNSPQTSVTIGRNMDYYLEVWDKDDNFCQKQIFHYPVAFPCNMKIVPTVTCSGGFKNVSATVEGDYNTSALMWQDCTYGTDKFKKTGLDMDEIMLTVVDTITGCYAIKNVTLECPPPTVPPWAIAVIAAIAALCIFLLLFLFFKKKP